AKPLPFPVSDEIYNMAPVPEHGYPGISDEFDQAYSDVVRLLDLAWSSGGSESLREAIDAMLTLKAPATALMDKPRQPPFGPGNFGPSFRFLPAQSQPATAPALPGAAAGAAGG